jgi:MFS family permease
LWQTDYSRLPSFLPNLNPLRSREFCLIYIGQFVSAFGSAMTYIVIPFQIYALTHSTLAVGLIGLVEFLPMLSVALIGGALADHFDRRTLILWVELALVLCCGVLAWNAWLRSPHVVLVWVGAGLMAGLFAVHRPAMEALMQQVLPVNDAVAAGALNSIRGNFAFIVGPGLAGLIVAKTGASGAFAIDGLSYVVSIMTLVMMRTEVRVKQGEGSFSWQMLLEGWRYARRRQDLLGTYLIDMNAVFFGMPNALFPAMAEHTWGTASLGLLYAAPSLGAMLMALGSGWTEKVRRHGLAITWAAAVWGLAIVCFGLAEPLWLALIFLATAGAADMVSGIFRMAVWNQSVPPSIRGRTAAIEMISYHTGPSLGNAEAGFVARLFGIRASVVSGGILCVMGSALLAMLLPKFIAYDSAEGIRRREEDEARLAGVN